MRKLKVKKDQIADMKMETASFSIVTDSGLHRCEEIDIHKSHIKLCRLIHYQELDLIIERNGNDVESVSGAFDLVKWEDLNLAQTTVQRAVVRADLFNTAEIRTQLSIVHRENGKWNLICTLWLDSPAVDAVKLRRAQSVGLEVLQALGTNPNNPTETFCFDQLTEDERVVVLAVAHETLCESGGHTLRKPISVFIDDGIQLTLSGRLGAKPSRSNFAPEAAELVGKCRGFVNDHKQRALLFSPRGCNDIEIGFMEWQLEKKIINLENIEVLNRQQVECKIYTNKTTDAGGKTVYQFVSMEAANDANSAPDLFTPALDDNKNSVTETSITISKES